MSTITAERRPLAARFAHHRWTVADVERMLGSGLLDESDRVELIDGALIDMAPIGSRHAFTVDAIARRLQRLLGERHLVRVQNPIRLGELSEPQPDIAVARDRSYAAAHPEAADVLLLIELADTTLEFDRDLKLPLYARHGIPECWLVEVAGRKPEHPPRARRRRLPPHPPPHPGRDPAPAQPGRAGVAGYRLVRGLKTLPH